MSIKSDIIFKDEKLTFWAFVVDKAWKVALFALSLNAGALGKGFVEMFLN
jgi:hypothetical protein